MHKIIRFITNTFAIWALIFAAIAYIYPTNFKYIVPYIPWLLGVIMFSMGINLSANDFKEVFRRPVPVIVGVSAQFTIMPLLAYILAVIFNLPSEIAIGVILVGACPGGTSSNVIAFLARGNIALSVCCTSVSTLLAPILTPAIFYVLASQWLVINASSMYSSVLKMVIVPIIIGVIVRSLLSRNIHKVLDITPVISIVSIIAIITAVIAANKLKIAESGLLIITIVILHNSFGYFLGYIIGKLCKLNFTDIKTIAIEVGMQNSGLGVALAGLHFAASPITAVPGAIFSVWHNISGAILASWWSRKKEDLQEQKSNL